MHISTGVFPVSMILSSTGCEEERKEVWLFYHTVSFLQQYDWGKMPHMGKRVTLIGCKLVIHMLFRVQRQKLDGAELDAERRAAA